MACGIGVCLGCAVAIKTEDGFTYKRVCKDGPVFDNYEIDKLKEFGTSKRDVDGSLIVFRKS